MEAYITIKDVLNAIRKNGYKKIQGSYYEYVESNRTNWERPYETATGACAFGQAALNLGMHNANDLDERVGHSNINIDFIPINQHIRRLNDMTEMTLPEIADVVERQLTQEELSKVI